MEKNGALTPFDVMAGAMDVVFWHCQQDATHPSYKARVNQRTISGTGCTAKHPLEAASKARASDARRARLNRTLARRALVAPPDLGIAPTVTVDPMVTVVPAVEVQEQGNLWEPFTVPPAAA